VTRAPVPMLHFAPRVRFTEPARPDKPGRAGSNASKRRRRPREQHIAIVRNYNKLVQESGETADQHEGERRRKIPMQPSTLHKLAIHFPHAVTEFRHTREEVAARAPVCRSPEELEERALKKHFKASKGLIRDDVPMQKQLVKVYSLLRTPSQDMGPVLRCVGSSMEVTEQHAAPGHLAILEASRGVKEALVALAEAVHTDIECVVEGLDDFICVIRQPRKVPVVSPQRFGELLEEVATAGTLATRGLTVRHRKRSRRLP